MKKQILFLFATISMLFAVSSCNEIEEPKLETLIIGTWDLNGVQFTKSATIGSETISVTVTFNQDGTFALTQVIGRGRAVDFAGTYTLTGDVLNGKYSDGATWGSQYNVAIEGTTMTMTSVTGGDIYSYVKK